MSGGGIPFTGRKPTRVGLAAVCLALICLAATTAAAQASSPGRWSADAAARKPSQATVAKRLVDSVTRARTTSARSKAMLELMKALRIGVVTSAGRPLVVSGEPNSARLFHLYDFELRTLGAELRRGETHTLDEVAGNLTKGGLELAPGTPFPPELLNEGLRGAVRRSLKRPNSPRALLSLVVRELGLRRGTDLSRARPAADVRLDSLQAFLVTTDVAVPVLRKIPLPRGSRRSVTLAGLRLPPVQASGAANACERFTTASEKLADQLGDGAAKALADLFPFEKYLSKEGEAWVASSAVGSVFDEIAGKLNIGSRLTRWGIRNAPRWAVRGLWKAGRAAAKANGLVDLVHGSLLAFSIKVESLASSAETHYGHAEPGEPIVFGVRVFSQDDYGETAAKCGALLGVELPRSGPVKDVTMLWQGELAPLASRHGTIDCGSVLCTSTTGPDGVARLTFTPRVEAIPRIGIEKVEQGHIMGIALYQSRFGGGLASTIAQFLTPKSDGTRWFVGFHQPRGYLIEGEMRLGNADSETPQQQWRDIRWKLGICGQDPYRGTWVGRLDSTEWNRERATGRTGILRQSHRDLAMSFTRGVPTAQGLDQPEAYQSPTYSEIFSVQLLDEQRAAHVYGKDDWQDPPTDNQVDVPIRENENCPEP